MHLGSLNFSTTMTKSRWLASPLKYIKSNQGVIFISAAWYTSKFLFENLVWIGFQHHNKITVHRRLTFFNSLHTHFTISKSLFNGATCKMQPWGAYYKES